MVKFQMNALSESLRKPLEVLGKRYCFCNDAKGRILMETESESDRLSVSATETEVRIACKTLNQFLRGVAMAIRKEREGILSFSMDEKVNFTFNGLMVDCSRNGVLNIAYAKETLDRLAMMGHNVMMLYMEDVYEVEGEPYFGYLRGRYSKSELKELDDYADTLGIELIPCVQTLAHMDQFLCWDEMSEKYIDIDNILYVGKPEVACLLDKIIRGFSETLRTRRIHLGMDEAYHLGRGRYADEHGLRPKPEIMKDHLNAMLDICRTYGLKPIIWDDMFFSAYSKANAEEFSVPEGIDLMYWDYYNNAEEHYKDNLATRGKIAKHLMFAGGAWRWTGFAPHHSKTIASVNASLSACKKAGVKEVMVTAWADDGCECPVSTCLFGTVLFAEHMYSDKPDPEEFKKNLLFFTGMGYETYMKQEEFDILPEFPADQRAVIVTPSKYSFYEDPLCSLFVNHVKAVKEDLTVHYRKISEYFEAAAKEETNPVLKASDEFYGAFGKALSLKWNLGLKLHEAYQGGKKEEIRSIVENQMKPLIVLIEMARAARMKEWYLVNKSCGFESLDIRFGGIKQRIESSIFVLEQYLDGSLELVEPLEEPRLDVARHTENGTGAIFHYNRSLKIMTPSRMTW